MEPDVHVTLAVEWDGNAPDSTVLVPAWRARHLIDKGIAREADAPARTAASTTKEV